MVLIALLALAVAAFEASGRGGSILEVPSAEAAELYYGSPALVERLLAGPETTVTATASQSDSLEALGAHDVSNDVGVLYGKALQATIHSEILQADLPFRVYLPPGYEPSSECYPVLYLLHGNGTGGYAEWAGELKIGIFADGLILKGDIRTMIIVMPHGDHSYFMNHAHDGERWADYTGRPQDLGGLRGSGLLARGRCPPPRDAHRARDRAPVARVPG